MRGEKNDLTDYNKVGIYKVAVLLGTLSYASIVLSDHPCNWERGGFLLALNWVLTSSNSQYSDTFMLLCVQITI
jgi:hypothetical protein